MGSTGNDVFKIKLMETSNIEDVKITDITFTDVINSGAASKFSFYNMTLWDGSTQVGGPISMTLSSASAGTIHFSFATPIVVTKASSKTLTLKGDVCSISLGCAVSGSAHSFQISNAANVVALGKNSNTAVTVTGTSVGNALPITQTKLSISSSLVGSISGRPRVSVDNVANLNFTADSNYQVSVNKVVLTLSGGALTGAAAFNVNLINANTNANWGSSATSICTPVSGACSVTFNPAFIVSAGATEATKVRVNSSTFTNGALDDLKVTVKDDHDVIWNDGVINFGLDFTIMTIPFSVASVNYN
jgi:hypothetical protein